MSAQMENKYPVENYYDIRAPSYVGATKEKRSDTMEMLDLSTFKTKKCPNRTSHDWKLCPYWHEGKDGPIDKRRNPMIVPYENKMCPNDKCPFAENCRYCHNRVELCFHPKNYKTSMCREMEQKGTCSRGRFCSFAHTMSEIRHTGGESVSKAEEPVSYGPSKAGYAQHVYPVTNSFVEGAYETPLFDATKDVEEITSQMNRMWFGPSATRAEIPRNEKYAAVEVTAGNTFFNNSDYPEFYGHADYMNPVSENPYEEVVQKKSAPAEKLPVSREEKLFQELELYKERVRELERERSSLMHKERPVEKNVPECLICGTGKRDILLRPCMHVICESCSNKSDLHSCPFCLSFIVSKERLPL